MAKRVLRSKALAFFAIPALTAVPASAQSVGAAGSLTWSKSEDILGAPSALEAILAKQNGISVPVRAPVQPASYSYSRPAIANAAVRLGPSPGVWNGRPDVFGSVALRVDHTPLDARWKGVEHSQVDGPAARFAEAQRGKDDVAKLEAVDWYVNKRVHFVDDSVQWGRADVWSPASVTLSRGRGDCEDFAIASLAIAKLEAVDWYVNKRVHFVDDSVQWGRADVWSPASVTLSRGRGDCEDFAIAKLAMLRRAGFAEKDLYVVILKDLVRRADHAVLVARASGHMYVLDNGTDRILDSESVPDYRPILTFASSGTWTHGYRMQPAPMNIAANEAVEKPTQVAAVDQRSWSASLLALSTGLSR